MGKRPALDRMADMNRLYLLRHVPACIAYVAREALASYRRFWFLTEANRNPDNFPY